MEPFCGRPSPTCAILPHFNQRIPNRSPCIHRCLTDFAEHPQRRPGASIGADSSRPRHRSRFGYVPPSLGVCPPVALTPVRSETVLPGPAQASQRPLRHFSKAHHGGMGRGAPAARTLRRCRSDNSLTRAPGPGPGPVPGALGPAEYPGI